MRFILLSTALVLAGCANSDSPANRQVWVADGEPVTCIRTSQIRTFRVVNDQTIDFEINRNQAFRNTLPHRCSGLAFGQKIRHNSRTSQLCSMNSITVVNMGSVPNGPTCPLGRFQPMKRVPAPETAPTTG